jgi:hypothetical protein
VTPTTVPADGEMITFHIPMKFTKRGGRKLVVTPDGPNGRRGRGSTTPWSWRGRGRSGGGRCWTAGVHATLVDLAKAKGITPSYVSIVLRLTLLAPDIVEALLEGRPAASLSRITMPGLLAPA